MKNPYTVNNLQIPIIIDTYIDEAIMASSFNELFELADIEKIRLEQDHSRYCCFMCGEPVRLDARRNDKVRHGHTYHFKHPSGTGLDCEWKTGHLSKGQIYKGVQEGVLHHKMKALLKTTLEQLKHWEVIDVDRYFIFNDDRSKRGKPDVHARFKSQDVVFEIQLRSESPQTLLNRKALYKEKEWQLIWISADNSEIVSEQFSEECIKTKQVHKDIAFLNRGNWFIFNKDISKKSLHSGNLLLLARVWLPVQVDNSIEYDWHEKIVNFRDLYFDNGETYVSDFYQLDNNIKQRLKLKGKNEVKMLLKEERFHNWENFLLRVKQVWPTVEVNGTEKEWLKLAYKSEWNDRSLKLKKLIIQYFGDDDWVFRRKHDRWNLIADRVHEHNFGIKEDQDLRVIEKLLLILGYDLSDGLNTDKKSYVRACHFFLDDQYSSFIPYRSLCERAIDASPFKDIINENKTILERNNNRVRKPIKTDLDDFLEWFISHPRLPNNSRPVF